MQPTSRQLLESLRITSAMRAKPCATYLMTLAHPEPTLVTHGRVAVLLQRKETSKCWSQVR